MNSPDLTPERFFNELYDQTVAWMTVNRNAQEKARFSPQIVRNWAQKLVQGNNGRAPVSLDLTRAVILEDIDVSLALVLGRFPRRWADQESNWGLQYGVQTKGLMPHDREPIDWLKFCVDPYAYRGTGDFYVYPAESQELWSGSLIDNMRRLGPIDSINLFNECIDSIRYAARLVAFHS